MIKYRVHSTQFGSDSRKKEKNVKLIQKKWLIKLGIVTTKKNIDFHYKLSIFNEKFKFDKKYSNLNEYSNWLLILKKNNISKKVFNVRSFNKVICLYYFGISLMFSGHGVKAYTSYKNSNFYIKNKLINFSLLLFCYLKINNFYFKKLIWYILQVSTFR